jgi:hypothetical protein
MEKDNVKVAVLGLVNVLPVQLIITAKHVDLVIIEQVELLVPLVNPLAVLAPVLQLVNPVFLGIFMDLDHVKPVVNGLVNVLLVLLIIVVNLVVQDII